MSEQPSKLACFMGELRRRHVFRVAVGYAAVAFVVLQLSEIVLIDPELPEAHDILALIEERLDEERIDPPTGIDSAEPMTEVRIVRPLAPESVDVGVRAVAGGSLTVSSRWIRTS